MTIDFRNIDSIPQLIKDFLDDKLTSVNDKKFSISNFKNQIKEKGESFSRNNRSALVDVLQSQLSGLALSEKQSSNLDALSSEDTFTITTGHQLNLFSGPVFFIYKILQTIKTAEFLKTEFPDKQFVPIFWMATEDHDFEEIDHFKTENHYYEIKAQSGGAVGRINIEDQFFINAFQEEFRDHVFGTELILMMKEAYKKGHSLAEATRLLVHRLFSEFGLLMIDGDDKRLKSLMIPTFEKELLHQELYHSTKNQIDFLQKNYHKVQVNPREINLFYLTETRNRIEYREGRYFVLDTDIQFSQEEILADLQAHPERFSPNAVLRPAYQETVLPNLAYVGGNAEIMYWIELTDYFKNINVPFPVLIPRNSMLFLKEKQIEKLGKLNLSVEDLFKNLAQLVSHQLLDNHDILTLLQQKEKDLVQSFADIKATASTTDKSFANLVEAEETRQLKSFDRMKKRLLRAEKIKQKEYLQRMEELFLSIHPGGSWQERQYNFSVFYADSGSKWLDSCYQKMNVENSEMIISTI